MFGSASLSLPRARALDVALYAATAHATGGAIGASDPEAVAGTPALWLPAGACRPASAGVAVCLTHCAACAAPRWIADRGPGRAAQDPVAARGEDQIRWRQRRVVPRCRLRHHPAWYDGKVPDAPR